MDFSLFSDFTYYEWIITGGILLFFFIQLFFYLALYRKPYSYEAKREGKEKECDNYPSVSVIIASKNESEDLKKNLPDILSQDYPNFEVIVVNSGSTDETDMILKSFEQSYSQLYHTFIPADADDVNVNKLALTLGIKAAKNDILLFTEAYCKPSSNQWIKEFAKEFNKGREVVLGYCKLHINKKTGMRNFILYDNLIHSLKYLSMAISNKPFMGIGRNMAYKKELFFNRKGFSSILNIEGGEDDLFINRIATKKNTGVVISPESMTETDVISRFSVWRSLKSKYIYTKQFYKGFACKVFFWETFSKFMFYLFFIVNIIVGVLSSNMLFIALAAILFIIRFIIQLVIINKNSKLFGASKYHLNLLFFDIFQPINNFRFKKYANKRNRFR